MMLIYPISVGLELSLPHLYEDILNFLNPVPLLGKSVEKGLQLGD